MVDKYQKRKKIIEKLQLSEYNDIRNGRGERLNLHRKLLGKRFSPTCEYQKLLKNKVISPSRLFFQQLLILANELYHSLDLAHLCVISLSRFTFNNCN